VYGLDAEMQSWMMIVEGAWYPCCSSQHDQNRKIIENKAGEDQ